MVLDACCSEQVDMEEERAPPGDYGDQYDDSQHGEHYHAEPEQQHGDEARYDAEEPSAPPQEEEPQPPTDSPHTEDPNVVSLCWVAHCVPTNYSYFFLFICPAFSRYYENPNN